MTKFLSSLLKSVALIGIGFAAALYAPAVLGPLPVPGLPNAAAPMAQTATPAAPETAEEGPKAPSIRVIAAANIEIVETIAATGSIMPRDTALVGSDVAGLIVEELYFDVGDIVKKGDQLARLDRSNIELQLAQITAQAAQNAANLAQAMSQTVDADIGVKQAQEDLDRIAPLVRSGVASKAQRDNAQNALDSAKARAASAQQNVLVVESQKAVLDAQRKQTELQLAKTELLSPVDGLVLVRSAAIGQVVSGAAGPLFTIATGSEFELAAEVSESELARLKAGMSVAVNLPGRTEPVKGQIRLISPQVDSRSRLGTVKVALPVDPSLRNGSFARGEIEIARSNGVSIPAAAVLYRGQEAYAQKVVDGRIVSTPVQLGLRDNSNVEIISGLAEGDEVVSRAGTFVSDGDAVTPVRDDQLTGATN
ncbi:MAG: efflux RND transporter periplasmic adaptor subunit [Phyllobacteriaceae bacterium]|nr:efflux RND transporter periplasmic adaptor subunit [Phyllobacteriaceae bacterium]